MPFRSRALKGLALALLFHSGCRLESPPPENGPVDAGLDTLCGMVSTADTGVLLTACDPATGQRCNSSQGQTCTWDVLSDEGECRCASPRVPLGQPCALGRQNCEAGLGCLFFAGDSEPICRSVCDLADGRGCENLSDLEPTHAIDCLPVRRGPDAAPTTQFGVCVDLGQACDPLDDRCPTGEQCSVLGQTTACDTAGSAELGEPCVEAGCARGGLCVTLADETGNQFPAECYAPCDVSSPGCNRGDCIDVGLPVGICFEP